ncbi:uncharacterized protein LOC132643887 [Lycium barbarum]|uniref:uncharacterized protein LOC132643887 n=1 Tax=Lycium barbarum TaxID=112863 RepID=UPI00293EB4F5|nr:uncharacterized protein LOC132643887 [Lycium barbarum]
MFGINVNKSPGSDSYGSGFFKAAWSVVGQDVCAAIQEFFKTGKLLKQLNATIISLIPKVSNPTDATQFRPISCSIFSVKVNGDSYGYFKGKRGLRLLFVLLMEYLSRVLKKMSQLPDFRYHPMCKEMQLTHLTFPNDLMIFCKGAESSGAIFILPQSVLKVVDKKCREFLWGSNKEGRKMALVSWDTVCKPKKEEGLNVKSSKKWNLTSVGKLIFLLITNKEKLWVKWIHGIYMQPNEDFWTHIPSGSSSGYWKNLNNIKLGMQHWYKNDRYILSANGMFSVNQSYLAIVGQGGIIDAYEVIWSSLILPKHRFILWLAYHRKLMTKDRMADMGIQCDNAECVLCEKQEVEDAMHLFTECPWTRAVCTEVLQWVKVQIPLVETRLVLQSIKQKQ